MFNNLAIYRLDQTWNMTQASAEELLQKRRFSPCPSQDHQSSGWVPPCHEGAFIHTAGSNWLISLQTETKILPSAVIKRAVQEVVAQTTRTNGYAPGRKQIKEITENVILDLLPKAFTKLSTTQALINPQLGWLLVDASAYSKAEAFLSCLIETFDSIPLVSFKTVLSPTAAMTTWLETGSAPTGFTIDMDCDLKAVSDAPSSIRYTKYDLASQDIQTHLAEGRIPTKLAMTYNDRLSFSLIDSMLLKKLTLLDSALSSLDTQFDSPDAELAANFFLIAEELTPFLDDLGKALGGDISYSSNA